MTPEQLSALIYVREAKTKAGTAYPHIAIPLHVIEVLCTIPLPTEPKTVDAKTTTGHCRSCNPTGVFVYGDERCRICNGSGDEKNPRT